MDLEIKNVLEQIVYINLNGNSLLHCSLPIRFGELGVRLLSHIALPSRSNVQITSNDQNSALNMWKSLCPEDYIPVNVDLQESQDHQRENKNHFKLHTIIKSKNVGIVTKRLRCMAPRTSPYLGTLLGLDVLGIATGIRLGPQICEPYTWICGYLVDKFGTHGLLRKREHYFVLSFLTI